MCICDLASMFSMKYSMCICGLFSYYYVTGMLFSVNVSLLVLLYMCLPFSWDEGRGGRGETYYEHGEQPSQADRWSFAVCCMHCAQTMIVTVVISLATECSYSQCYLGRFWNKMILRNFVVAFFFGSLH